MEFLRKKEAISYFTKRSDNKDVVLLAKDTNESGSKKFIVTNKKKLYKTIKNGDNNFYEFWKPDMEIKFSLDIDLENDVENPKALVLQNAQDVVTEFKNFLTGYSLDNVIFLKSNPTDKKINSYHIVFNKIKFKNHTYCKNFFAYLKSKYEMTGCDESIYNMTVLRCCYCTKMSQNNALRPFKFKNINSIYEKKISKSYFYKTLVTNVHGCKVLINKKLIKTGEKKSIQTKNSKEKSYDIFNERKLEQILKKLPDKYVDDYNYWIKIGMILHNIDENYFKLWETWSKTNKKYSPDDCLKKWKTFTTYDDRKKLGLGTLIKYCQNEGLHDIIPKHDIKSVVESYDSKEITLGNYKKKSLNMKYLNADIFKNHLDKKLLCVQSEKGTGKTYNLLKALFDSGKDKEFESILFLSSRRTFGIKLLSELKKYDFKLYSDIKHKYIDEKRIICQIDSLLRLELDSYDLIIVDECESLARYLTSQHFTKNPRASCVVNNFEMYLREATNVYILDADLSERCMNYYMKTCEIKDTKEYKLFHNEYKSYENYKVKYTTYANWVSFIMNDIELGKKVVVPMASNNKAKDLQSLIKNMHPDKKVLLIHKESSEEDKLQKLMKINETWIVYDVIIYTPSVCMGVSFDVPDYFERIYAYGCHQSLGAQEFAQMLHRVRTPKLKEIILAVDKYRPYDKEEDYLTYEDTESMLCNNFYLTHFDIHNNFIHKKSVTKNKIVYPYKEEAIYDLYVRNCKELVLDQLNFTAQLFSYLKAKNYKLQLLNCNSNSFDQYLKDITQLRKERIEEERVNLIDGILDADEIDTDRYLEMIKRRDEYLDEEEINSIRKYNFQKNYNIDDKTERDDMRDLLDEYYTYEKMRWYKNLKTILNTKEQETTKKLDILKHNQKVAHSFNNTYQDFTSRNKYAYHFYPLKIITHFGFNINELETIVNYPAIQTKVTELKPQLADMKYALYKNYNLRKIPSDVIHMKTAECLRFINKILYHQYGTKIVKINYATIEENIKYKLSDANAWDGLPKPFSNIKNIVKYEAKSYSDIDPADLDFIDEDAPEDEVEEADED